LFQKRGQRGMMHGAIDENSDWFATQVIRGRVSGAGRG
jgi:hypothetical protein